MSLLCHKYAYKIINIHFCDIPISLDDVAYVINLVLHLDATKRDIPNNDVVQQLDFYKAVSFMCIGNSKTRFRSTDIILIHLYVYASHGGFANRHKCEHSFTRSSV